MNKNELTVAQAIEAINQGFGSVYTKEDVIGLLNNLVLPEAPPEQSISIPEFLNDNLANAIDWMEDYFEQDIIDYDSVQLRMDYGNTVEVDQIDLNNRELRRAIENGLERVISELREVLTKVDVPVESEEESSSEGKNDNY